MGSHQFEFWVRLKSNWQLSFRLVSLALAVLVAATAAVPSAATDARSGNARIKLSNNANSQRKNGASTAGAKSKNIDNYHSIVHVMHFRGRFEYWRQFFKICF